MTFVKDELLRYAAWVESLYGADVGGLQHQHNT